MKRVSLVMVALLVVLILSTACTPTGQGTKRDGLHATVPSVVGDTVDEATRKLETAGYRVGEVRSRISTAAASGEVVSQDPAAGTALPRKEGVDLVVVK